MTAGGKRTRLLGTVWALAAAILLVSCTTVETPPAGKRPLKVGWTTWTGWYPMAIAQELKLFEKHGVAVEPILYNNYTEVLPDISSGKLDGGFSGLYEVLKANISDIKVVLATDYSDGAEGLVVIGSIRKPRDLKGKRIGIQGAMSGSEFLITTFLRKHRIEPRDLTFLNVSPEAVLDRMPVHIQGGYTWDPFLSQAIKKGYRLMFTTADMKGMVVDVVAFQGNIVKSRGDDLRKFVSAWFEAEEYWRRHPDDAARIIAKVTGLKREEIKRDGCRIFTREDNLRTFKPGEDFSSIYYTARKQAEFFISIGDTSMLPDIEKILTPAFLQ